MNTLTLLHALVSYLSLYGTSTFMLKTSLEGGRLLFNSVKLNITDWVFTLGIIYYRNTNQNKVNDSSNNKKEK